MASHVNINSLVFQACYHFIFLVREKLTTASLENIPNHFMFKLIGSSFVLHEVGKINISHNSDIKLDASS